MCRGLLLYYFNLFVPLIYGSRVNYNTSRGLLVNHATMDMELWSTQAHLDSNIQAKLGTHILTLPNLTRCTKYDELR